MTQQEELAVLLHARKKLYCSEKTGVDRGRVYPSKDKGKADSTANSQV